MSRIILSRVVTVASLTFVFALLAGVAEAQAPTYTIAPLLGFSGGAAYPRGLNNDGYVVGSDSGGSLSYAAMWQPGATNATLLVNTGSSSVFGVNDNELAVGYSDAGGGATSAFLWDLDSPTGAPTSLGQGQGYAINNSGTIVGFAGNLDRQAAVWTPGAGGYVESYLSGGAVAYDINELGQIVGTSTTGGGTLWDPTGGSMEVVELQTLGGTESSVAAINDSGYSVGYSTNSAGDGAATLWDVNGAATQLVGLGGTYGNARAINSEGWVVGESSTGGGATHGCLWIDGVAYDLNTFAEDWSIWAVTGINDYGQIIGYGRHEGQSSGFIMNLETPDAGVPEPCSLALLPMALGGLAMWRRRKKG